jgi:hypothetical protein
MRNAVFWDVTPCAFLRTDVSEESVASNFMVKINSGVRTALGITSKRSMTQRKFSAVASYC